MSSTFLLGNQTDDAVYNQGTNETVSVFQSTAVADGILTQLNANLFIGNGSINFMQLGIYTDDTFGNPLDLIEYAEVDDITPAQGGLQVSATMSGLTSITFGVPYWIGWYIQADLPIDWEGVSSSNDAYESFAPSDFVANDPWTSSNGLAAKGAVWGVDGSDGPPPPTGAQPTLLLRGHGS